MIRVCITLILICISISISSGQALDEIIKYAQHLENEGNNDSVIRKEYLRAYYYDRNNQYPNLSLKLSDLFVKHSDSQNALLFLNIYLNQNGLSNQERFEGSLSKVKLLLDENDPYRAQLALYGVPKEIRKLDINRFNYFLGICHIFSGHYDRGLGTLSSLSYIQPSELDLLEKYCKKLEKITSKNHNRAILLSAFLPGLGQFVNGDYRDSANSFLLNSSLLYLLFDIAQRLSVVDSILSVGPWFGRYYVGGFQNAKTASINNMKRKRSAVLLELNTYLKSCQDF